MWEAEEGEQVINYSQKQEKEEKLPIKYNSRNYNISTNYNSIDIGSSSSNSNKEIVSLSITAEAETDKVAMNSNAPYHEDINGSSLYYSDLPVRSQTLKEKYKFYGRKVIFYLFLAYFITAITMFPFLMTNLTFWAWLIHTLYWELDLTSNKNNMFLKILHPLSFVLSYVVMVTSIILLIILNPDFIGERAAKEHHSIGFAWALNVLIHFCPPIFLTLDLFLHKEHIKKRHRIFLSKQNSKKTWLKDLVKCIWCICSPMIIVAIWFGSGFTIQSVYGVTNYNLSYLIPSMCVVDIIVAIFFLFIVRKKSDTYIRLNI